MQDKLIQIMSKYRPYGIVKGSEYLLPPDKALHLVEELGAIGVTVMGVDGWHYVDREKGWIVQDLEVDLSVDESILQGDQSAQRSVPIVKEFIANQLPDRTDFVSLTLDISVSWKDLFAD